MLLRRVLFIVALLLLASVLANGLVERERGSQQATAPEPSAPAAPARRVDARMPAERVVDATVGDLVSVTVTPEQAGEATIDAVGVSAPADPEVPGTLEFFATEPGRYPVVLDDPATTTIGTVVVRP